MALICPVSDLRNYNSVLEQVSAGSPVYLTVSGRARYTIRDIADDEEFEKTKAMLRLRVSKKWLQPLFRVEVLHFLLSAKADGRKKCKEWFRLMPKPPRPRGKAPRYEYSQRACGPSDTSHGGFLTV